MKDRSDDDLIREAVRDYNRPPEAPRETMWRRIEATRRQREPIRPRSGWNRFLMPLAAAAAILVGIAIGRVSVRGPEPVEIEAPVVTTKRDPATPYRLAATSYLSRTETLLTQFRSRQAPAGSPPVRAWAGDLLTESRLLLDSPAVDDPKLRMLLLDLELILAGIVQHQGGDGNPDDAWITRGLEDRAVMMRLRNMIPAGASNAGS